MTYINPCGPLRQIIVESIPLFQDQFLELLLRLRINPRLRLDHLPIAKSVLFNVVVVINVTVLICVTGLSHRP